VIGGFAAVAGELPEVEDDRELVEAAQEEPDAFAAIYTRYAQRVYLYIRTRVSSDDDAMDLTQQVFVKSFNALPKYRWANSPLSAWLFRIARNCVIDHQRRFKVTTDVDAVPGMLRDHAIGPEDAAVHGEEVERLRLALQRLDRQKRDVLALRYAGDLKIREIASVTGKSEEATKKQLSRALQTLRKQYDALS
jgi:RNA polymerase sigma-70 factor (ECF subfamily)